VLNPKDRILIRRGTRSWVVTSLAATGNKGCYTKRYEQEQIVSADRQLPSEYALDTVGFTASGMGHQPAKMTKHYD
jgi:hypothetical protein